MSKIKEEAVNATIEDASQEGFTPPKPTEGLTEDAFGIYKDMKTSEWKVAHIKYNPATGETGKVEAIQTGGFRDMAIEQFRITVARRLMI